MLISILVFFCAFVCLYKNYNILEPHLPQSPLDTIYGQELYAYSEIKLASWSILRIDNYVVFFSGQNQMLELTWSPKEEGSQRQMILFKVEGVVRLQAFLIGKAEMPAKPKKVTFKDLSGYKHGTY